MRKTAIVLACAFAAVAMMAGCNAARQFEGKKKVKAEYYPKKRKMLVIPFQDEASYGKYFDSTEGGQLAESLGYHLQRNKIDVRTERQLAKAVKTTFEQTLSAQGEQEAFKALAETYDCELVLVGQIIRMELGGEKDVNVRRGSMTLSAKLLDMKNGGTTVWQKMNIEVQYPEGWEYEIVSDMDINPKQLRSRLMERGGEVVAECFFDHIVDLMK